MSMVVAAGDPGDPWQRMAIAVGITLGITLGRLSVGGVQIDETTARGTTVAEALHRIPQAIIIAGGGIPQSRPPGGAGMDNINGTHDHKAPPIQQWAEEGMEAASPMSPHATTVIAWATSKRNVRGDQGTSPIHGAPARWY
jgi:hypothetical protein